VTEFSPYQAYPGQTFVPAVTPPPILVAAADPAPQRRWTVLLRIILAVPHLIVLYILTLVAGIIAFVGWWGALFTGRLPEFAVTFQSGYLRWYTRFSGYLCLLTDVWPPFSFDDDPSYPVRVAIPPAQRLNRAAVFFRCILVIPAWFLYMMLAYAMAPIGIIAWVATLIMGRLPRSLHSAYLAVMRYQMRVYAYGWLLLTPAYPGGLYGDGQATAAWADTPPTAPDAGVPGPGYGPAGPGYGTAGSVYGMPGFGTPGYGPAGGYGFAGGFGRPVFQPATWLLRLTAGARRWVTAFIVVGAVFLAGETTLYVISIANGFHGLGDTVRASVDLSQVSEAHATLDRTMSAWEAATANCEHKFTCVTKQDGKAARAFGRFADRAGDPLVPSAAATDQNRLIAAARTLEREFTSLGNAKTVTEYQVTFTGLQQELNAFNADYQALVGKLRPY